MTRYSQLENILLTNINGKIKTTIDWFDSLNPIDFIKEHRFFIYFEQLLEKNPYLRKYPNYCSVYKMISSQDSHYKFLRNFFDILV